jgi:hypothetical protein
MALINQGASLPSYAWAATRLLIAAGGKLDGDSARLMLTPPTLLRTGENDEYDVAVKTLTDLGIVRQAGADIELIDQAWLLAPDDVTGFGSLLRRAALDPARNAGLAESDNLDGPKDLVRALAWFLTRDPAMPLDWDVVGNLQDGAFPSHLPPPFANGVRWGYFMFWAPALGFAARSLLHESGPDQLVPDCTVAVRDTVLSLWSPGQSVRPGELIDRVQAELPVLPGGRYSRALGLDAGVERTSPVLSNTLLTGAEVGWITLERASDASEVVLLTDAGASLGVSSIIVNGSEW